MLHLSCLEKTNNKKVKEIKKTVKENNKKVKEIEKKVKEIN
jgi:hypothetical protein